MRSRKNLTKNKIDLDLSLKEMELALESGPEIEQAMLDLQRAILSVTSLTGYEINVDIDIKS